MVQHHLVKPELAESQHQVGKTFQRITLFYFIIVIIIIIIIVVNIPTTSAQNITTACTVEL